MYVCMHVCMYVNIRKCFVSSHFIIRYACVCAHERVHQPALCDCVCRHTCGEPPAQFLGDNYLFSSQSPRQRRKTKITNKRGKMKLHNWPNTHAPPTHTPTYAYTHSHAVHKHTHTHTHSLQHSYLHAQEVNSLLGSLLHLLLKLICKSPLLPPHSTASALGCDRPAVVIHLGCIRWGYSDGRNGCRLRKNHCR